MAQGDLGARVFLLQQGAEGADPLVRLVLLSKLLDALSDFALLGRVEQGARL